MESENEIERIAGKRNPFQVPDGYFEKFEAEIMEKIGNETHEETQVLTLWDRVKPWLYMAASFLLIVGGLKFFLWERNQLIEIAENDLWENAETYDCFLAMNDDYFVYNLYEDANEE